ncbi:MAG: methylase [Chloroflexi bacterium]|nr:MAG: methylase [Chloroflexota bacterium]
MIRPKPHPWARPRRPEGQPTRGKTASHRLRRVDTFLLRYDSHLLARADGPFARAFFVDLGYGFEPRTTLECVARLRAANPILPVLGVEIDPERVAAAQPLVQPGLDFRLGGFNLPLAVWPDGTPETVRAVRAFNVLRQYAEAEVAPALARLAESVLPGGLLIEGTSDPLGRIWVAHVLRRSAGAPGAEAWQREALVFSTNFRCGFDPAEFQPVLPKDLVHHMLPGEAIYAFFEAWKRAARLAAAHRAWGSRDWFVAAAHALAEQGYRVNLRPAWLRKGFLLLYGLSPSPIGGVEEGSG